MKSMKRIAAILTALLLCACPALAETQIEDRMEGGSFFVQILNAEDLGWYADIMEQDDPVMTLYSAETAEGTFTARYDAVADGEATVSVMHLYNGFACDEQWTWTLLVKDGTVQEITEGSYTANNDDADMDPYLIGEWHSGEVQMTVEKNPAQGWDVEIHAPEYVFKTTIYQDCSIGGMVYDKGKYWETTAEEALAEADIYGSQGSFTFDEDGIALTWCSDQNPDDTVVFTRE